MGASVVLCVVTTREQLSQPLHQDRRVTPGGQYGGKSVAVPIVAIIVGQYRKENKKASGQIFARKISAP
jgi:hypothetical protein